MSDFWTTLVATSIFACVAFAGLSLALAIPLLCGRKLKRRCVCAASREAMRIVEERERAAFDAKRYRPEKVDPNELPLISSNLASFTRKSNFTREIRETRFSQTVVDANVDEVAR